MKGKRTGIDFSKHVHTVDVYKHEDKEIQVDHFKIPDSMTNYIQFINTDRVLTITGDFGNWVFCRPFVPSIDGYVSDGYWLEKLRILSSQVPGSYDGEATASEIQKLIDEGLQEYGYKGDELKKMKEWYTDLLTYTDDEYEYVYHAYRGYDRPNIETESIPFCKKLNPWLNIIFDAFDEICRRIKEGDENQIYDWLIMKVTPNSGFGDHISLTKMGLHSALPCVWNTEKGWIRWNIKGYDNRKIELLKKQILSLHAEYNPKLIYSFSFSNKEHEQ
ncbi:MAG: hypothetical protein PHT07_15590 [Paludibacter sp.]|nr:hypothetical protein [Paludibacter sp.]